MRTELMSHEDRVAYLAELLKQFTRRDAFGSDSCRVPGSGFEQQDHIIKLILEETDKPTKRES